MVAGVSGVDIALSLRFAAKRMGNDTSRRKVEVEQASAIRTTTSSQSTVQAIEIDADGPHTGLM
jgi:NH3-dependent NAD+ synthetase